MSGLVMTAPILGASEVPVRVRALLGFALALVIMASIREKLELADVPAPFKGLPIAFVVTGLIALAFTGFSGLIKL